MTDPTPIDAASVQQLRAARPDSSVWVDASAGTGKTKVLTDRVLALLLAGTSPERILCLTFTRAAAAEMSLRVTERLGQWAAWDDARLDESLGELPEIPSDGLGASPSAALLRARARRLFADVLDVPGSMKIQTIHAFCASLLARFPLEAGIAPHFQEMDDRTAGEARAAAIDAVLARARGDDGSALTTALQTVLRFAAETRLRELIDEVVKARGRISRMIARYGGMAGVEAALRARFGLGAGDDAGTLTAAACGDGAMDRDKLVLAAQALAGGSATDAARGATIAAFLAAEPSARGALLNGYREAFLTKDGNARTNLMTKKLREDHPDLDSALFAEADRLIALEERVRAVAVVEASAALLTLGEAVLDAYGAYKTAHARVDYDDLILTARALLEGDGAAGWVLYKLDGGIDHLLIDEAQDTSPEQWEIVRLLTEEFFAGAGARDTARTIFAVGDFKQSIFGFQGADPESFTAMRHYFERRVREAKARWEAVDLQMSFRSTDSVLRMVDETFADGDARDGLGPSGAAIAHTAIRQGQAGSVELWPAIAPVQDSLFAPWSPPLAQQTQPGPQARLARVIAGRIRGWLDRGEILESRGRPVRPGDIMVLVRRRTDFVDELVRALKARDVDVAGVDRMVLTDQLAVRDLMAFGHALLLPEDDLTLATVLKGPLVGLDEDGLFALAHGRGAQSLWASLRAKAPAHKLFADAHRFLAQWMARVDYLPPHALFAELLGAGGGRKRLLARLGPDADDPIDEFLSLALAYQRAHVPSLQGFLHWIEAGRAEVKRDLEQAVRDEVRILTAHGAKGLQAPIVFLPDTMGTPAQSPHILWDKDAPGGPLALWRPLASYEVADTGALRQAAALRRDQEYRRLLYVALTRAEDRLIVCGWQTKKNPPANCWYRLTERAMARIGEQVSFDFTDDAPEGWAGQGWRHAAPQLATPDKTGDERDEAPIQEMLPDWAKCPPNPEALPPRTLAPSRFEGTEPAVLAPLGGGAPVTPGSVTPSSASTGPELPNPASPGPYQRGRLVHRLLQTLPDLPAGARASAAARFLAQPGHGLDPGAQADIAAEVLALFEDPSFAPLFVPGARAEVPIIGEVAGVRISGQIDRLVIGADEILIADYKTNRPPPDTPDAVPEIYLRQLAAYRAVLRRIYPKRRIRCALVWTATTRLMAMDDALLRPFEPGA